MKKIDGGNFMMGSKDPYADYDEKPMHPVIVDDFYMSETEVTQALWVAVLGTTSPCYFLGNDLPVNNVTVEECERFITELNRVTKRKFRLPTEAEWEYAARGGTTTSLYNGEDVVVLGNNNSPNLDPLGWYPGNCGRNYTQAEGCDVGRGVDLSSLPGKQYQDQKGGLHPVGKKVPNAYGLYDMLGNVAEWCSDFYGPYTPNTCINPKGPKKGYTHVLRGGSFEHKVEYCRVSSRGVTRRASAIQETRHYYVGLRLVLEPK